MGLLRASIIFIVGNFTISIINNHIEQIKTIPIVGTIFGDEVIKFIKKNQLMALLISLTIVEFII